MKRSAFALCIFISVSDAIWRQVGDIVPDSLNPLNLLFTNKCIEDLGCFYTGDPFYHPINRPISLPPTSDPKTKFFLYTTSNPSEPYELEATADSLFNSSFNAEKDTKIVIHGFNVDLDFESIRFKIKDAFVKLYGYNVIVVDWSQNNGPPYAQAVANIRVIGAQVAKLINFLVNATGISTESVHVIGHSLGGQMAGYIGERVENLGRITGLDPAGPYFQHATEEVRLDKTDALFVDIIHSDGAEFILTGLGISQPIGHMDFYPNGGRFQPECSRTSSRETVVGTAINFTAQFLYTSCDHGRAKDYFLESINSTDCRFRAVLCSSYSDFEQGSCPPENATVAEMGFHAKKIEGLMPPAKFFLRTNGSLPFCIEDSIYL